MAIYGVYTGKDLKSYICALTLAENGATLPAYRLTFGEPRKQTGSWQDLHVSTVWGSLTVILCGQIAFGVSAGTQRTVVGKAGDIFVFIDTQGDGHSVHNPGGGELFQVANMRFADPIEGLWNAFKKGFNGWPDNVLPPGTYAVGGPPEGRHSDVPDPDFDMKLFNSKT
jgi:hypothetical protein